MSRFGNSKKAKFLSGLPSTSIEDSDTAVRSKFCLSFLDTTQPESGTFQEWDDKGGMLSAVNVLGKLKEFSRQSLDYWKNGGSPLVIYGDFPKNSDFKHPNHVPHDVEWGRFRLGNKVRLVGFVIPDSMDGKKVNKDGKVYLLDRNTFYIVFLDKGHKFYKIEKS